MLLVAAVVAEALKVTETLAVVATAVVAVVQVVTEPLYKANCQGQALLLSLYKDWRLEAAS